MKTAQVMRRAQWRIGRACNKLQMDRETLEFAWFKTAKCLGGCLPVKHQKVLRCIHNHQALNMKKAPQGQRY